MQTKKPPTQTPLIGHATFSFAAALAGMLEISSRRPPLMTMVLSSLHAALV
ncbi:MAG TPA: hypothetical protein VHL79_12610 [Ramlibacter sp.]|jgi:hypothetical protein|nr:hypothetical protein [Ramlibacter sp.]